MTDEATARGDAARLKRLPVRRPGVGTLPAAASPVVSGSTFVGPSLIAVTAVALTLLLTLAPLSVIGDVARACMFAGLLVAVGVGVFARVVHDGAGAPDETLALRRLTLVAALVAVTATAVGLGVEIASIAGRGLAGVTDADGAAVVARNGFAESVMLRTIGLGLVAFVAYYDGDAWTSGVLGGIGIALSCVCCVFTGHEATHGLAVQFAVVLHVLAGSIWLGGLFALGITLRARRRASDLTGGAIVVRRFSIVMSSTVAVLIAAGVVLTWLLVGTVGRLVSTDYGLVLCAKIALAATVLGVAAINQRRLVPAVVAQSARGWQLLGRTVLFEQSALLGVVALTAVLVNLNPGS